MIYLNSILILMQILNILKEITLLSNKKIFFASDFHLGAPNHTESLIREKKICDWLDSIKSEAQILFLVGDLFDFWYEYKHSIPKGYSRFLGKIAELSDLGIEIEIPTLEQRVKIRIPSGTQHQQQFRLKGHGLPGPSGIDDLIVVSKIKVPKSLSARERGLWEQLSRESGFHPRTD